MKSKISLVFGIFLFTFLFNLITTFALNCVLRDVLDPANNCPVGETCVFSMFQETDSHAGNCSYGKWKVCCEEPGGSLNSTIRTTSCYPNEAGVISLKSKSDSHVEKYQETNYLYHVCLNSSLGKVHCNYASSCSPGEGLASIKQKFIGPNTDSHVAKYDYYTLKICCVSPFKFKIWIDEPRLFTIGRGELTNIYVQNLGGDTDSYNITYIKNATMNLNPADHLISVSIPSSRIHSLEPGRTGNTFATIRLLGPIDIGNITFTITSENNPSAYLKGSIDIMTGYPISLPEFELIGMIELLFLVCLLLVISYSSHFR